MNIIMKIYSAVECKECWMSRSLFTPYRTKTYNIELMANLPQSKSRTRGGNCAVVEIPESNL